MFSKTENNFSNFSKKVVYSISNLIMFRIKKFSFDFYLSNKYYKFVRDNLAHPNYYFHNLTFVPIYYIDFILISLRYAPGRVVE